MYMRMCVPHTYTKGISVAVNYICICGMMPRFNISGKRGELEARPVLREGGLSERKKRS